MTEAHQMPKIELTILAGICFVIGVKIWRADDPAAEFDADAINEEYDE